MYGMSLDPRLRSHPGMTFRERQSAVRFRLEGMYRTANFNKWRYLMLSIADTNVPTMGSGDRRVLYQASTLALSVYRII